jgi:hypothetical protein
MYECISLTFDRKKYFRLLLNRKVYFRVHKGLNTEPIGSNVICVTVIVEVCHSPMTTFCLCTSVVYWLCPTNVNKSLQFYPAIYYRYRILLSGNWYSLYLSWLFHIQESHVETRNLSMLPVAVRLEYDNHFYRSQTCNWNLNLFILIRANAI